jgi:hypothetical protein
VRQILARGLEVLELAVALSLLPLLVALHVRFWHSAGGLWRDEVHSIELARIPLREVWQHLALDSFPILHNLTLRAWSAGGIADGESGLRALGLLVGILMLGALWLNARLLRAGTPLLALALFAMNPSVILYGDALRPHGLGTLLVLLSFGAFWWALEAPHPTRILLAATTATLSVQCLYPNALLLLAVGLGGASVAARQRALGKFAAVALVGGPAAVSLLPYIGAVREMRAWTPIAFRQSGLAEMAGLLASLWDGGVPRMWMAWAGLLGCGTAAALWRIRPPALFAALSVAFAVLISFVFLSAAGLSAAPWYFLPLSALVASSFDVLVPGARGGIVLRTLRVSVALWAVAVTLPVAWGTVHQRQTRVDLLANRLEKIASPGDLIVLNPWFLGITFRAYYHGAAAWTTIPPLEDLRIVRYDLLALQMQNPDALAAVLPRIAETLRSGHLLWWIGSFELVKEDRIPPPLPPAPLPSSGWYDMPYLVRWTEQASQFVERGTTEIRVENVPSPNPVNGLENPGLLVIRGWSE